MVARILALLGCGLCLAGCKTPGETVIGRANGRDIVVTEAEIQERADERGVSRDVALRELRREQEISGAIAMQKQWKMKKEARVEGARIRTQTDESEAPDEEKINELIAAEQTKRADLRTKQYYEEYGEEEREGEETEQDEERAEKLDRTVSRLDLPSKAPQFESREEREGWETLESERRGPF